MPYITDTKILVNGAATLTNETGPQPAPSLSQSGSAASSTTSPKFGTHCVAIGDPTGGTHPTGHLTVLGFEDGSPDAVFAQYNDRFRRIDLWAKFSSFASSNQAVLFEAYCDNGYYIRLMVSAWEEVYVQVYNDEGSQQIYSDCTGTLSTGTWHHFRISIYDEVRLGVNGDDKGSITFSATYGWPRQNGVNAITNLLIGKGTASDRHLIGYMDAVEVLESQYTESWWWYGGAYSVPTSPPDPYVPGSPPSANPYGKIVLNFDTSPTITNTAPTPAAAVSTTGDVAHTNPYPRKFGASSLSFADPLGSTHNPSGVHVTSPDALFSTDRTLERRFDFWLRIDEFPAGGWVTPFEIRCSNGHYINLIVSASDDVYINLNNADFPGDTYAGGSFWGQLDTGRWHHFRVQISPYVLIFGFDGNEKGRIDYISDYIWPRIGGTNTITDIVFGRQVGTSYPLIGWMDAIHVTEADTDVWYGGSYTVPTSAPVDSAAGGGPVTVNVTGQSFSFLQGSVAPAAPVTVALSGQSYSYTTGTIAASSAGPRTVNLTGQAAVFQQGALGLTKSANVSLVGQDITFSYGTPSSNTIKTFDWLFNQHWGYSAFFNYNTGEVGVANGYLGSGANTTDDFSGEGSVGFVGEFREGFGANTTEATTNSGEGTIVLPDYGVGANTTDSHASTGVGEIQSVGSGANTTEQVASECSGVVGDPSSSGVGSNTVDAVSSSGSGATSSSGVGENTTDSISSGQGVANAYMEGVSVVGDMASSGDGWVEKICVGANSTSVESSGGGQVTYLAYGSNEATCHSSGYGVVPIVGYGGNTVDDVFPFVGIHPSELSGGYLSVVSYRQTNQVWVR